ncbi:flagellar filament capping protein FliD [Roseovarius mucosus]|uniref:Flagellar hook-associated protein 2 n=1 Tax=Roseovarius mucosus TaxID=215743 RepID=A0A1V0RSL7_9RHOB|nr:flagellar filament capping protein FliD [Roseovarius mucosus]ARE84686.1 flagellar hook-associated protein 2 [Roseovarius mucosus]|tara:strand:- start:742 stop:2367 length:1626 start_codon:yes stop_codon:yes gene_type:complete
MENEILTALNRGGTGINIAELADSLTQAEIAPRRALIAERIDRAEVRLSGYDRLRGQAEQMGGALELMRGLSSRSLSSDNSAVSVTVSDPGKVDLQNARIGVSQLAQSQVLSFVGFSEAEAEIGAGALTVEFGNWSADVPPVFSAGTRTAQTITFQPGSSLADMAEALSSLDGLSARVIDLGDGTFSLGVISETGSQNALRLSVAADADPRMAQFDISADPGAVQVQGAQDAKLSLNGIAVTRSSNQIDDLLPGVTLNVTGQTLSDANLSGRANVEGALEVMQSFVDIINATQGLVKSLTARGFGEGGVAGDLAGDSLADGVLRGMQSVLSRGFGVKGVHLSDIGIRTERDGSLSLDADRFSTALTANPALLDPLIRDDLVGTTVQISGTPGSGATAGRYALTRDAATGEATLAGVALIGSAQANGDWTYRVPSGPMRGLTLTVGTGTERAEINFQPSMVGSLQSYLSGILADGNALAQREDALGASIVTETTALEALNLRSEEVRTRYLGQFTQMEMIVTQLNSTGDYLTNLVEGWNADR